MLRSHPNGTNTGIPVSPTTKKMVCYSTVSSPQRGIVSARCRTQQKRKRNPIRGPMQDGRDEAGVPGLKHSNAPIPVRWVQWSGLVLDNTCAPGAISALEKIMRTPEISSTNSRLRWNCSRNLRSRSQLNEESVRGETRTDCVSTPIGVTPAAIESETNSPNIKDRFDSKCCSV
jgi:hypothetical protein